MGLHLLIFSFVILLLLLGSYTFKDQVYVHYSFFQFLWVF